LVYVKNLFSNSFCKQHFKIDQRKVKFKTICCVKHEFYKVGNSIRSNFEKSLPVQVSFPGFPPAQVKDLSRLKYCPSLVALNWFSQTGCGTKSSWIFFMITWYSPALPVCNKIVTGS